MSMSRLLTVPFAFAALSVATPRAAAQDPCCEPRADSTRGDTLGLSLEQAIDIAVNRSQEVRLAQSQVRLAEAQVGTARAEAFPQLDARIGYTRTFASPFSGGGGFTLPDSLRFEPDTTAPLADRVRYLERRAPTAALGGLGSLFGDLPFGQENSYTAVLTGSQPLYAGGRVGAGLRIAREFLDAARLNLQEQTADIELQVRSAYYRARLAQELVGISQAALDQAQRFLRSERLRREAGTGSELDVLRAEVSVANLQPQLIEATNAADVATLDLKRLIDVPLARPIALTTTLDVPRTLAAIDSTLASTEMLSRRAAIAAQERQVAIREAQVRLARSGYLPSVNLTVNAGRQIFPSSPFRFDQDWRNDVNAGIFVSIPIFHGGRTRAEVAQAQVAVEQERLRLAQLRESIQVSYQRALGERERARASIAARQLTVQQAQRVYDLTVLRYEQGLASQLEVSEARLSLLQARTNLAQAVADFHVAHANLARAAGAPMSP
jgi:outer membrane protein TolC